MLFRNKDGKLVEIKRSDFVNDELYYKNILALKTLFTKVNNTEQELIDICK